MSGNPLETDPDNLRCCATDLETGANTAYGDGKRFSTDAEDARAGFPGRARAKYEEVLDHWTTENNFIAGVVDNLAVNVHGARSGYIATDGGNAASLTTVDTSGGVGARTDSPKLDL